MTENYTILKKIPLSGTVVKHVIYAPLIAAKAKAGQFVILRASETGERAPITLVDWDAGSGSITVIVQSIGKTTSVFNALKEGERFLNVAGPLGAPVEIKKYGTVVCVGGGVGIAEVFPIARELKKAGNKIISILGARTKDLLILENEMKAFSEELFITTDDGSYGQKGRVTDAFEKIQSSGEKIDAVFVIGPLIMMKTVAELTKKYSIATFASLNPIMLDGTGMCGGCRVEIGGKSKFACVDGPMFDAHLVNFDQLMARTSAYKEMEKQSFENHKCRLDQY